MAIRFDTNAEPIPGYRLLDRLGSGGFGEVWKCEAPGGIHKAVKIIHGDLRSKDDDLVRYAEQELKALKRVKAVRHAYLLALDRYDIVDGRLLIVMELADCNLWDRFRQCRLKGLPGIPRDELLLYMSETAEVLDLMNHEHQLQHLDIKPQNIFLQYNHVKVGDFGQVKDLEGLVASVTGGITPVYAAPETFDGVVTRFCDQYSLACVYQELLTGQRPFDGTSMQQLLMQHLAAPPNLIPAPADERPALERALAKTPDERFPTSREFVQALRAGVPAAVSVGVSARPAVTPPPSGVRPAGPASEIEVSLADTEPGIGPLLAASRVTTHDAGDDTPAPLDLAEPPPELTGDGPLRPAVVIGLGGTGLRVLRRFRRQQADRFGPPELMPAVRCVYIDTDPDLLTDSGLADDEVLPAKLNRATHYFKPRLNGRTLFDGWMDPTALNRLPRTPVTTGLRPLGRLAFCDHYRAITTRLTAEIDAALSLDGLNDTAAHCGLSIRTNRPRVYVVAGLAGGTGGGMFLDVAYAVRQRLKRLGYAPDVVGLLFAPDDAPDEEVPAATRGAVYAALAELAHYSRPDTLFAAQYDDRNGRVRDAGRPFDHVIVLPAPPPPAAVVTPAGVPTPVASGRAGHPRRPVPGDPPKSGAAARQTRQPAPRPDPEATAADFLRLDLFGPAGAALDAVRPPADPGTVRTFGLAKYDWPRGPVLDRTARTLTGVVIDHWVSPDFGRARGQVPGWAAARFAEHQLAPDALAVHLRRAADLAAGGPVEVTVAQAVEPLMPKGWLGRGPDAGPLMSAVEQVGRLVGLPSAGRPPTAVEEAVKAAAGEVGEAAAAGLTAAVVALIDDPAYRLAGADEAAHRLLADLDRHQKTTAAEADKAAAVARAAYDMLAGYATPGGRKSGVTELATALRKLPAAQYQATVARRAARVYEHLKAAVSKVRAELVNIRQAMQALQRTVVAELDLPSPAVGPRELMPTGCPSVEEAAQKFLGVLTDDDLLAAEKWVQTGIERQFGGLYQACLNSADKLVGVHAVLRERTRAYLDARLGAIDFADMAEQRFGPAVGRVFGTLFQEAAPPLVGPGPWAVDAVTVVGTPPDATCDPLRQAVAAGLPAGECPLSVAAPDEAVVYREYPAVPLAALPQSGLAWEAAYRDYADAVQCSPHTRIDVPKWLPADG